MRADPMMARSTTRSKQRPDTLMQDRICRIEKTSCNARPDHTSGSLATFLARSPDVCLSSDSGGIADIPSRVDIIRFFGIFSLKPGPADGLAGKNAIRSRRE